MQNLQQHRQDSVEHGTSFDSDSEEENNQEGVLSTNSVWPDVLKNFNHQVIPLVRTEQTNLTIDTNSNLELPGNESAGANYNHLALEKLAQQFPQNTRQEVFGAKVYKDLEEANKQNQISKKSQDGITLQEETKQTIPEVSKVEEIGRENEPNQDDNSLNSGEYLKKLATVSI